MDLVPVYTAFIGAIVGAIAGALLSHLFTKRRDTKKEARETYQNFIYPFLNDVILYYETETHFRKGHDVEKNIDSEILTSNISENIKYGNSKLINAIFQYNSSITFFDGRGNLKDVNNLKIYFWFMDFSTKTLNKMGEVDKKVVKRIELTQKKYGIFALLTDIYGFENAIEILQFSWMWNDSFLDNYSMRKIKKYLEYDYFDSELRDFIFEIEYAFEIIKDGEIPEHIKELFDGYLQEQTTLK